MSDPRVSVVIVNWNHGHLLPACLEALHAQTYSPFDLTIVDNASADGSPGWIAEHEPGVQLQLFSENRGFCEAFDWGAQHTTGEFVLSLNADVTAEPDFISMLVQAASHDRRIGMVVPKLLRADDPSILDSTGLFVDVRRRPYDRGQGEIDRGQYDAPATGVMGSGSFVFGGCGAAVLYRRTMLEDVALDGEYLDHDFFAYCEDADLAWRARLRGWQCLYVPLAVARHARGWGDTLRKRGRATKDARGPRLALRNRYLMTIKNDAWRYLVHDLPAILGAEVPRLAYAAVTRPAILLGLVDLLRAWPSARRKRRQIRSRQVVPDADIRRWFVAPAEMARGEGERR
ncbi:MAG: glycosyltransferase family 2 protein [Anaerolineae bacterium]|nr:glycosyltransferase family 2 protein [Anaerolineae bacterium]